MIKKDEKYYEEVLRIINEKYSEDIKKYGYVSRNHYVDALDLAEKNLDDDKINKIGEQLAERLMKALNDI